MDKLVDLRTHNCTSKRHKIYRGDEMKSAKNKILCTNKFKNKSHEKRAKDFTQKWIQIITRMENYKLAVMKFDDE